MSLINPLGDIMINLTPAAVKAVDRFIRGSETPVAGLRLVVSAEAARACSTA